MYYQLENAIAGMAEASRRFDAPVISGNVSLYNESRGEGIYPTPVVGALGVTEDVSTHATVGFKDDGDLIVLLGRDSLDAHPADPWQAASTWSLYTAWSRASRTSTSISKLRCKGRAES